MTVRSLRVSFVNVRVARNLDGHLLPTTPRSTAEFRLRQDVGRLCEVGKYRCTPHDGTMLVDDCAEACLATGCEPQCGYFRHHRLVLRRQGAAVSRGDR